MGQMKFDVYFSRAKQCHMYPVESFTLTQIKKYCAVKKYSAKLL